ncbi:PD-(D/E)XK nuclease family transposase [Paenibacillus sp. BAC0078]
MNEPGIEKAMTALEYLSQDAEARRLYEMRQKYLHDEASMIEGAKEETKLEVAKNLVQMGMDLSSIAKATGLPEDEIRKREYSHRL